MNHIIVPDDPKRLSWEMTLPEVLDAAVRRSPEKVFVEIACLKLTYRQFRDACASTAAIFRSLGVERGDRVCLFLPNRAEVLYCWFGLSMLGAVCVPINTAYKRDETAFILNDCGAKAVVAHQDFLPVAEQATALAAGVEHRLALGDGVSPPEGWLDFSRLLASTEPVNAAAELSPHDVSMLQYTSGTTGDPKGVQVTHSMYVAVGQGFCHWTGATAEDRFFTCLPYFHANAQYYSTMGSLVVGGTLAVADRFSASRFWSQAKETNATIVNFIGMMLPVLAKQPPPADGPRKSGPANVWLTGILAGFPGRVRRAVRVEHHRRVRHDGDVLRDHRGGWRREAGRFLGPGATAP